LALAGATGPHLAPDPNVPLRPQDALCPRGLADLGRSENPATASCR
jgi:hypothetical protein